MYPLLKWIAHIVSFIFIVGMIELVILTVLSFKNQKEEENETKTDK